MQRERAQGYPGAPGVSDGLSRDDFDDFFSREVSIWGYIGSFETVVAGCSLFREYSELR